MAPRQKVVIDFPGSFFMLEQKKGLSDNLFSGSHCHVKT